MLEIKDLRKIYKTKNGADVHALDGVSLRFPETGMVFLLGKSGSGKSTLLNVCGGLDSPSDGEIIVKGRSSKDFTQSDFDSYRNTFIGFIFQEYNILNEFSVEDNIALALELQGKPKDRAAINKLLEDVDLQGYAKRKPNTLSGGQKQRIAIARALVKAPEIIMADEPTGALDSNTGKQVFETLKKLSQDKLVIVVSHDRDFAEQYGDRIIELKDGQVISDVSKTQQSLQQISANVNTVGDVLCVKCGSDLTERDFEEIKAFLKKSDRDVIITNGQKDIQNFKKVSRINDDGSKEVFQDTVDTEGKQYDPKKCRFIRSKLPMRHAIKIGVSSLRTKPFRLFFTILLCTIAFAMFGLLSTLSFYDTHATFLQTMQDTKVSVMQVEKDYQTTTTWFENGEESGSYEGHMPAKFTQAEVSELAASLGVDAFGGSTIPASLNLGQSNSPYWSGNIHAFAVLPDNNTMRAKINGTYPQNNEEAVISSYMANVLLNCKAYDSDGNLLELNAPEDIIGKKLAIGRITYTITGILDSGEIPAEYDVLKDSTVVNTTQAYQYENFLSDGLHQVVFVNTDRLAKLMREYQMYTESIDQYTAACGVLKSDGEFAFPEWSNLGYHKRSYLPADTKIFSVDGNTEPGENEALISTVTFVDMIVEAYYRLAESTNNDQLRDRYYRTAESVHIIRQNGFYTHDEKTGEDTFTELTAAELNDRLEALMDTIKQDKIDLTIGVKLFDHNNSTTYGELTELKIIGVYWDDPQYNSGELIVADTVFTRLWDEQKYTIGYYADTQTSYKESAGALYSKVYLPYQYSEETVSNYWDIYSNTDWREDGSRLRLAGDFIGKLQMIDSTVESLSTVFFYVALVLAVFAILLFSNFISTSISQKKREIGILRAVGARSADVFKIFFSESFVIAAICIALSVALSIVACDLINKSLAEGLGASLFVFGAPSLGVLIAVAFVTVLASTFLPVHNAARKKPVDSIRAI